MFSSLDIFSSATRSCLFICKQYKAYSRTFPVLDIFSGKLVPGNFFRKLFLSPTFIKNQMVAPLLAKRLKIAIFAVEHRQQDTGNYP